MQVEFTKCGWEDFNYWFQINSEIHNKVLNLINAIIIDPFNGIGKPEPLKFGLTGYWSRRITGEHRIVYFISGRKGIDQKCTILQCKFH